MTQPTPWRRLGAWALLLGLAAAALLALRPPALAQDEPEGRDLEEPVSLLRGAELYATHCAACHAALGQGREGVAPSIEDAPKALVDLVIRAGRMPPGPVELDGRDRRALVAFMDDAFELPGEIPDASPVAGNPARGQQLYATNCAACHGAIGGGGVAGGGAFTPELITVHPVAIAEAIRVGPFEMPAFSEEQISDEGLDDIVAFLAFVAAERGTPLGFTELNPVFASAFVFVLALVVIVSSMWLSGRVALFPDSEEQATRRALREQRRRES
jgi:ubiquinol-cytochrome c reductase cytochrome c subunit